MARTGTADTLGTAEGALLGRAAHTLHADRPVLDDPWAVFLLDPSLQAIVRSPAPDLAAAQRADFDAMPLLAVNIGSLCYAEDVVDQAVERGVDQYVVLGAGFDSFALRRDDLAGRIQVFEIDHPDVQALKRERIANADRTPAALPIFVPVDFETMGLEEGLSRTEFDPNRPSVFSWMNTLPYLTAEATTTTLRAIRALAAPDSRLVLNYPAEVAHTPEQEAYLQTVAANVSRSGEPWQSRWTPEAFEALLAESGFAVVEHATERDLETRYFAGRADGMRPGVPARLIVAKPQPSSSR